MVLEVLTGNPLPGDMLQEGCLLYIYSNRAEFAGQMPSFEEWGLRPVGLVGPCENPVIVARLLTASTELAPRVVAGRQASLEARGTGVEVPPPPGAPGVPSSRTREARLGQSLRGRCSPRLPRLGLLRPRLAIGRWCPIALPSLALLRLTAWVLLHPRHALVLTSSTWVSSAWTSPPSARGRSPRVAVYAPSDR